jgi:hypothetical protein
MPIMLASQEAEIRRTEVSGQTGKKEFARPHLNEQKGW